jgi:murein DD-endopeptidase MepM/ murein hydrolase activator NlpD
VNPDYYRVVSGTPGHNGLDLALLEGTQLYAPINGYVVEARFDHAGWGWYVKIEAEGSEHVLIAHLSGLGATKEGDWVEAGTPVALSGNTGNSTGPHVHVGWRPLGSYRTTPYKGWADPEPWLARLKVAGA